VLREAFDLPFADIAEIIGREEPATRQLAKRAREHVASRRPRFEVDHARRRQVTQRFNGAPAMVLRVQGRAITVVSLVIVNGVIQTIYLVANPEKLGHIIA